MLGRFVIQSPMPPQCPYQSLPDKHSGLRLQTHRVEVMRAGIPIHQVAEWLGDDPRTVLKVYAHVLGERQTIDALRRLNELASGPSRDPRTIPENSDEDNEEQASADKNGS